MKIETASLIERPQNTQVAEKQEKQGTNSIGSSAAFAIDSSARENGIFGNAVYSKPSKDAEDVMEEFSAEAEVKDATMMKNETMFAANTTSEEDAKKLEEKGYCLTEVEIPTIVTETDKIKAELAKAGVDISIFGDGLSEEQLKKLAGNEALAAQLARQIMQADLPVTQDNLEAAIEAVTMAGELSTPGEGAVKYMLDNQLPPTIGNLYKAEYSGSSVYRGTSEKQSYEGMTEQITAVILAAGMEVTSQTMADSTWLLDNEIPLTVGNLTYMQTLKNLQLPAADTAVAEAVTTAMTEGGQPKDAALAAGYSLTGQAQEAEQILADTGDKELEWLADNGMELTVEHLKEAKYAVRSGKEATGKATELALLTAKRQLEEARLAMTAKANYSLLKQGISIDTKPLAELVETLKAQEDSYYEQLLGQAGIPVTENNVAVYSQTTEAIDGLKQAPAYILGVETLTDADLQEMYEAGKSMQEEFRKAGESYETMMTTPRRDMGDTIQKAFRNIDEILTDIGLEQTPENERAVRILAYNNREITAETVLEIKAKDAEVQQCFRNMTPSVVREMIRRNQNPLDMTIEELNRQAVEIKGELGIEEEERFSKYLWKMDQKQAMTEEERSAFLGIYRLITQVEKTDGAAIGSLMQQGSPFTMRNLLTQVRSGKHSGREYGVDDDFAGVDSRSEGLSITQQIEKGYQANCMHDIAGKFTPELAEKLLQEENWQELTPEELLGRLAETDEDGYLKEELNDLNRAAAAPQEVYELLQECDMPASVRNILAAQELLSDANGVYRRFFEKSEKETDALEELAAAKEAILKEFAEAVKSPEELAKAQKELADTAERVMKTMIREDESVTSIDLRQMKLFTTQIALGTAQAKEERYAIPVLVGDEVTSVSLKIVRGKEKKGFVDIAFSTESLGSIKARLTAAKEGISGYVASDREETTQLLLEHAQGFEEELGETVADIRYITAQTIKDGTQRDEAESKPQQDEAYQIQTKRLYHMAESFIRAVKGMK